MVMNRLATKPEQERRTLVGFARCANDLFRFSAIDEENSWTRTAVWWD